MARRHLGYTKHSACRLTSWWTRQETLGLPSTWRGLRRRRKRSRRGRGQLEGRVAEDGVAGVSRAGEDGV